MQHPASPRFPNTAQVRHAEPQRVKELAHTRATLRQKMLHSPLCDGPRFVAGLEDTYHRLWQRCGGAGVESAGQGRGRKGRGEKGWEHLAY